jgi:hypothetical protein
MPKNGPHLKWCLRTKLADPGNIRPQAASSGLRLRGPGGDEPGACARSSPANAMRWGQVTDCSHLLVFAAWDTYCHERINTADDRMRARRLQE